jgi:hypothetical protein
MKRLIEAMMAGALTAASCLPVHAQSTDGFHEIQVFPVVVDSTSFTQRFSFRAVASGTGVATVRPRYHPAEATSQAGSLECPVFTIPFGGVTFEGLRAMCPALAAGSQFGFLTLEQEGPEHLPFSGFSRVSNPAGAGFAVEAFPAHTFTSALVSASGLRRSAAKSGAPAFQSNCFVGRVGEHAATQVPVKVVAGLVGENGMDLGQPTMLELLPGQMVRLLDVFSAGGLPSGDYDRASFVVRQVLDPVDAPRPGIIAFCTVQDNTSFGADFRIAKQEYGILADDVTFVPASYDGHVMRASLTFANPGTAGSQPFAITVGEGQQNTHVFYFRHPDWISCELLGGPVGPGSNERLLPESGLEMRLLSWDASTGWTAIVGGAGVTGWDRVYLGDKRERGEGLNTEYLLQVEDNTAMGALGSVDYGLRCLSGSGHSRGEMILYQRAANDF